MKMTKKPPGDWADHKGEKKEMTRRRAARKKTQNGADQ